jgi:large subunit ribosomal protein L3
MSTLGLLARKVGMTQIFDEADNVVPVTVLRAGPCLITKMEQLTKYSVVQLGFEQVDSDFIKKPNAGVFNKLSLPVFRNLKEFRVSSSDGLNIGDWVDVSSFELGMKVNISGKTIGKGFSGLQKRHNFTRGPMTHGSKNHRQPGSIGMGTTPGRVLPGKKMSGQLGNKITNIKKLKIVQVNAEENILVVKGSVPGKPRNLLSIIAST